jgi:hypothetical protein
MTQHVDPKRLFGLAERPNNNAPRPARGWPAVCADGSLVIDADGTLSRATPEQQQIAIAARAARAVGRKGED